MGRDGWRARVHVSIYATRVFCLSGVAVVAHHARTHALLPEVKSAENGRLRLIEGVVLVANMVRILGLVAAALRSRFGGLSFDSRVQKPSNKGILFYARIGLIWPTETSLLVGVLWKALSRGLNSTLPALERGVNSSFFFFFFTSVRTLLSRVRTSLLAARTTLGVE